MLEEQLITKYDQELASILNADLQKHFFDIESKAILFLTKKFDEQLAEILTEDVQNLKIRNLLYNNPASASA